MYSLDYLPNDTYFPGLATVEEGLTQACLERFVLMLLFNFSGVKPPRETLYRGHLKSKIQEDGLTTVS